LGFSKLLKRKASANLSEDEQAFLGRIELATEFMLSLVDDLLDISRIEAGELHLDVRRVDVCALIERNVGVNRLFAEEKQIEITFEADPGIPLLEVDPHKLEQVLNNLISNAVKFSHPGSAVDVRLRRE